MNKVQWEGDASKEDCKGIGEYTTKERGEVDCKNKEESTEEWECPLELPCD